MCDQRPSVVLFLLSRLGFGWPDFAVACWRGLCGWLVVSGLLIEPRRQRAPQGSVRSVATECDAGVEGKEAERRHRMDS